MRVASPGRASQPRRRLADGPSTYRAVSLAQLARQLGASEQGAFKPCAERLRGVAQRARLRGSEIAVLRERYRKARYPPGAGERDVELMSAASIARTVCRPPASPPPSSQRVASQFTPKRAPLAKLRARLGGASQRAPRQSLPGEDRLAIATRVAFTDVI